jgi:hypothetical protein
MADPQDDLIQALVTARERGISRVESQAILRDVFDTPWSQVPDDENRLRTFRRKRALDTYPLHEAQP